MGLRIINKSPLKCKAPPITEEQLTEELSREITKWSKTKGLIESQALEDLRNQYQRAKTRQSANKVTDQEMIDIALHAKDCITQRSIKRSHLPIDIASLRELL